MKIYYNNSIRLRGITPWLLVFILCFSATLSFAQESHKMLILKNRADVLDNAKPHKFFKIPELKSGKDGLEVNLILEEKVYNFNGDQVKLRTYQYASKQGSSEAVGPWGPTLRIKRDDRLSVIVHNRLPNIEARNYRGSMSTNQTAKMDKGGEVDEELEKIIVKATDSLITEANLVGADIEQIEKGKSWIIHGKIACQCPVGMEGTCKKIDVEYPVEYSFNYGSKEFALRIYENADHGEEHNHNVPHGFNTTNLHTHGFHVSPYQDDIFRKVDPSFSSYYTYDLEEHTAGTMWYHPHVHGSTGLQVASGVSGAIIIEDSDEVKKKYPNLAAASEEDHERVMIFNQIYYDTEIGELTDFEMLERIPRGNPPKGTTVNGVVLPDMQITPGEVQRWRLIHSGYGSSLGLEFPKEAKVWQIAVDGIMFSKPQRLETVHMAPGNRTDLLIQFPKDMKPQDFKVITTPYNVLCEYFHKDPDCLNNSDKDNDDDDEEIVHISLRLDEDHPVPLNMKMPTRLPGPGVGHDDIKTSELINEGNPRVTSFDLTTEDTIRRPDTTFTFDTTRFMINMMSFEADTIPDILTLGTAEEWKVKTLNNIPHPYHIHINPFQVIEIGGRPVNPPMWKDVVMATGGNELKLYSRYQRYVGDFVIHCHILTHEDQGMMQRVRIVAKKAKKIKKEKSKRK